MDKIEITKEDFKKVCVECTNKHLDMLRKTAEKKAKSDEDNHINPLMFLSETLTLSIFTSLLTTKLFKGDDNVENV